MYEVQAVLKRDFFAHLDKYKDSRGARRWKTMVGEVLRTVGGPFEQASKTDTGRIVWRLRDAAAPAAGTPAAAADALAPLQYTLAAAP